MRQGRWRVPSPPHDRRNDEFGWFAFGDISSRVPCSRLTSRSETTGVGTPDYTGGIEDEPRT